MIDTEAVGTFPRPLCRLKGMGRSSEMGNKVPNTIISIFID